MIWPFVVVSRWFFLQVTILDWFENLEQGSQTQSFCGPRVWDSWLRRLWNILDEYFYLTWNESMNVTNYNVKSTAREMLNNKARNMNASNPLNNSFMQAYSLVELNSWSWIFVKETKHFRRLLVQILRHAKNSIFCWWMNINKLTALNSKDSDLDLAEKEHHSRMVSLKSSIKLQVVSCLLVKLKSFGDLVLRNII